MTRFVPLALGMLCLSSTAFASATVSIPLQLGQESSIVSADYRCGDAPAFNVQYINTDANQLALLPVDGQTRIFVNVIAGSGARYVSGPYEWWTKGGSATLANKLSGAAAQECSSSNYPAPR